MSRHDLSPPWVIHSRKRNRICGRDGIIIAEAWYPPSKTRKEDKHLAYGMGNATAGLIVTAVNSHEILLAQNDWLKERLATLQLPPNSQKNIEEWLVECGMPSFAKEITP